MSVEIEFLIGFLVAGTPVSLQAKRAEAKTAWKRRVREASNTALPEGHFSTESSIAVTLLYFPETQMQGDLDNIVKPILDAMRKHIYADDKQVERILVQKFEPGKIFRFRAPSQTLATAIQGQKPVLYVRVSDNPMEGLV
jgi:crossover junction endodeoxyribonuclease RusA